MLGSGMNLLQKESLFFRTRWMSIELQIAKEKGDKMLIDSFILACLISTSMIFLYKKLPRKVRRWLAKHPLLMDCLAMLLTLGALGTTVTALMAGAMVDVIIGVALYIHEHQEDFLFLFDAVENIKGKLNELKAALNAYNQQYKSNKANPVET